MKINNRIKNIAGWLLYFGMLALLIYGIPKAMSYTLNIPYPMASITSGSMWPALKTGDLVFIQGLKSKNDINIGDIIVYKNQIGFTIHRAIKLNEETVITKGDANNVSDMPVKYDEVIGKAVSYKNSPIRIPNLGGISILMNK